MNMNHHRDDGNLLSRTLANRIVGKFNSSTFALKLREGTNISGSIPFLAR